MSSEPRLLTAVAETFIKGLEDKTLPMLRDWAPGEFIPPYNPTTNGRYHGINLVSLANRGFNDPRWLTYRQAASLGWQIRKGEKGSKGVFWTNTQKRVLRDKTTNKPVLDSAGNKQYMHVQFKRPRCSVFTVFNATQMDGVPDLEKKEQPIGNNQARKIVLDSRAVIRHDQADRAFYSPATDVIHLPGRDQFSSEPAYLSVAMHELGHWTGHADRLDREVGRHKPGTTEYAREELRAELYSFMVNTELNIGYTVTNHRAYINSWISILKDDPAELMRAAADAEKINTYILNLSRVQSKEQETSPDLSTENQSEKPVAQSVVVYEQGYNTNTEEQTMNQDEKKSVGRTYLNVPYKHKEKAKASAKAAGFRITWDRTRETWFAPSDANLDALAQWLPGNQGKTVPEAQICLRPEDEFTNLIKDAGLFLEGDAIMDGEIHRVPVQDGKPGNKDGAYVGFLDGHPAGYFNNYRTGEESNWKATGSYITKAEKEPLKAIIAEKKKEQAAKLSEQHQQRGRDIDDYLTKLDPAPANYLYLMAKGITLCSDVRLTTSGQLAVPIYGTNGAVQSALFISRDGVKRFASGAKKAGGYNIIAPEGVKKALEQRHSSVKPKDLFITEGYSTGSSVAAAINAPVVVAFDAGNLHAVTQIFKQAYPDTNIHICADNDRDKEVNVGKEAAERAAEALDVNVILPRFLNEQSGSDFNDLQQAGGLAAVKSQIRTQVSLYREKMVSKSVKNEADISMSNNLAKDKNKARGQSNHEIAHQRSHSRSQSRSL